MTILAGAPLFLWGGFFAIVTVLLTLDLGLLHRSERDIGVRESLLLSAGYVTVSLCFALAIGYFLGARSASNFLTGYIIEKSLSMDNILVMSLVFARFRIPRVYQHRVLLWGITGVVLLRGLMIGGGAVLISHAHFVLYLFGAFLVFSGIRMLVAGEKETSGLESNRVLAWLRHVLPLTRDLHGGRFFVREPHPISGALIRRVTPLLLVLIFIELADIVFAVDSVPAVFAVTTDPFIVYTSNIFAILGLRALYFALAAMLHRFAYLSRALALVLVFIGLKIFAEPFFPVSSGISLGVTLSLLAGGIALSLYRTRHGNNG